MEPTARLTNDDKGQLFTHNNDKPTFPHPHEYDNWQTHSVREGTHPATQWRKCVRRGCSVWQERVAPVG